MTLHVVDHPLIHHKVGLLREKNISTKDFRAHIAHYVPTQVLGEDCKECKCRNIHGHSVKIQAVLKGYQDETTRMVVDFTELKQTFGKLIDEFIDHSFILPFKNLKVESGYKGYLAFDNLLSQFYVTQPKKELTFKLLYNTDEGLTSITLSQKEFDNLEISANSVYALKIGSFTFLRVPSTTAEDMARYFTKILSLIVSDMDNIIEVGVRFFETESASAYFSVRL